MKVVYIAGKVTGDPGYKIKFAKAAVAIERMGYTAMNPAVLPEGLEHDVAMKICLSMLSASYAICLLDDWVQSMGARREFRHAKELGIPIFTLEYSPAMKAMKERESDEWAIELEEMP